MDSFAQQDIKRIQVLLIIKEFLQILSRTYFLIKGKGNRKNKLSGYITVKEGVCTAKDLKNDKINEIHDLNCMKEITASHIILNISSVKDSKQFLSLPNDPRTASHTLAYFDLFKTMNVNIIW